MNEFIIHLDTQRETINSWPQKLLIKSAILSFLKSQKNILGKVVISNAEAFNNLSAVLVEPNSNIKKALKVRLGPAGEHAILSHQYKFKLDN